MLLALFVIYVLVIVIVVAGNWTLGLGHAETQVCTLRSRTQQILSDNMLTWHLPKEFIFKDLFFF
jgi:hypothetical protein